MKNIKNSRAGLTLYGQRLLGFSMDMSPRLVLLLQIAPPRIGSSCADPGPIFGPGSLPFGDNYHI